jgi:hypothetical protein
MARGVPQCSLQQEHQQQQHQHHKNHKLPDLDIWSFPKHVNPISLSQYPFPPKNPTLILPAHFFTL